MSGIRVVQCPSWGYPTEGAYYRDASSSDSVLAERVPLFVIHADDDPVCSLPAPLPLILKPLKAPPLDRRKRGTSIRGGQAESICRPLHLEWRGTSWLVRIWWREVVFQACKLRRTSLGVL